MFVLRVSLGFGGGNMIGRVGYLYCLVLDILDFSWVFVVHNMKIHWQVQVF